MPRGSLSPVLVGHWITDAVAFGEHGNRCPVARALEWIQRHHVFYYKRAEGLASRKLEASKALSCTTGLE
jgi:hypothetical protein